MGVVSRCARGYLGAPPARLPGRFGGPGAALPNLGVQRRLLRRNSMNHIGKLSFMSNTSPFHGCNSLCAAKPLFRQQKSGAGGTFGVGRIQASKKVSRTSPSPLVELDGRGGPEIFKGRRRACAPRHIPDRFPVTAGIRSETATRPLDSARFSRRWSQRRTAALRSPSSQCWPWVLRVCLPPSFSS